ncbi:MAG: serine hydrolase [Sideroxyarcus sp.]|nr:serine hydrolase [Sideroxyarcus sp.]
MRQLTPICIATLLLIQAPLGFASDSVKPAIAAQQAVSQQLDAMVSSYFKANEPGATVIVLKDGKPLLRKAYGMASVVEKRGMQADDVLRLGSITKQFTAVAIMLLVDQGRISLSDSVTKILPDYPESGKKITIEQLLTHTSGIPSYTSKAGFKANSGKDMSVSQMLDSIKNDAHEFEPGSSWNYSNSGYFLLGAIIEKVSGEPYAQFVAQHLFTPLGMSNSAYEGYERTKQARAAGHSRAKDGFGPSATLSMSQPYAAGSLTSTVDDLALWDASISAGKLLKPGSWQRAFTAYNLSNGESTHYGYGWHVGKLAGSPMFSHGGGINGFKTYALRLPQEKVYVAVLSNADGGLAATEMVASRLAAKIIGKPLPEFKAISLDAKVLDQYAGVYKIDEKNRRTFVRQGDKLVMSRTDGPSTPLQAYSSSGFFRDGNSLLHIEFVMNAKAEVTDAIVHQNGTSISHPRTDEALPQEAVAIQISHELFDTYVGNYQLTPNMVLSVRREGNRFIGHATGQSPIEIIATAENIFFAKQAGAQIKFEKSADGSVNQLVLTQGGRDMQAKKLP